MDYDVAIVGAGPAGCAAALTLARADRSVVVLEKRIFPRHKVCGGCLSGWAVRQLRELLGENCQLPGTSGTEIAFAIGGRMIRCPSGGRTRVVSRADLDSMLAQVACSAGAEFRFGQIAELARRGEKFEVAAGGQSIKADSILLASGLSRLASRIGFRSRPFGPPMIGRQWMTSAKAFGVAPGAVEMHWLRSGYIGLAAPNPTECIVAFSMKTEVLSGVDPLSALRRVNPGAEIWERIASAPQNQILSAAGFPLVPDRLTLANVMLIGDAAGYSEPFSGTGIGMAIHSGIAAAQAIIGGGAVAREYARAVHSHRGAMWRTRILSAAMNSDVTQQLLRWSSPRSDHWVANVVQRVHVRSAL